LEKDRRSSRCRLTLKPPRRSPDAYLARAVTDALAHAIGLTNIGAHPQRIVRVWTVENVNPGAVDLRSR
jgi:hypothetical protein